MFSRLTEKTLGFLVVWCTFMYTGCAPIIKPVPVPPRPTGVEWRIGLTFAPFTPIEWDYFAAWPTPPLWRVELDQAAQVQAKGVPYLLVAVAESDASVQALLPYLPQACGIELGNEPNFGQDAGSVNAWYQRMILLIRSTGYAGRILTAGVGNIDDNTLGWLQASLVGLPSDVVAGAHFYSSWQGQIPKLLGVLKGRPWAMTESGMDQPTPAAEQAAVPYMASVCQSAYDAGALTCIGYQTHSAASGKDANFGIFPFGSLVARPWEQSLIGAIR